MMMMMLAWLLLTATGVAQDKPAPPPASKEATAQEGSNRMVFDDQLVRGETAGGAIAITRRPPRALPPLVAERVSFLKWTIVPLLGDQESATQVEMPDAKRAGAKQ